MNHDNLLFSQISADANREQYIKRIRFGRSCLMNTIEMRHELHHVIQDDTDLPTLTAFLEGVISFCDVATSWNIRTQCATRHRNINVVQCIFPSDFANEAAVSNYLDLLAEAAVHSERFARFLAESDDWLNTESGKDALEDDLPELACIKEIIIRMKP